MTYTTIATDSIDIPKNNISPFFGFSRLSLFSSILFSVCLFFSCKLIFYSSSLSLICGGTSSTCPTTDILSFVPLAYPSSPYIWKLADAAPSSTIILLPSTLKVQFSRIYSSDVYNLLLLYFD